MTSILTLAVLLIQAPSAPAVVTVTPTPSVTLVMGSKADARLTVTVKKGFHVQANPASEPYLVPLRLEMEIGSRVLAGKPVYPPGKPYRLEGTESDLSVYDGGLEIRLPLEAPAGAAPGEVTLQGALHYQACDERVCLRPASVPVSLPVRLVKLVARPAKPNVR